MNTSLKLVILLACGHMLTDFYTNFVPVLLPTLMERLDMSLTASGMLVLAMSIASNVLQLAFGYWQDKYNLSSLLLWVIPLGALAICGIGWANSQPLLFLIVILNGLAVAAFHPLGSTLVTRAASDGKLGQKMSYYLTGGNFGFAAAPLAVVWFINAFPLESLPVLVLPALLLSFLYWHNGLQHLDTRKGQKLPDADAPQHTNKAAWMSRLLKSNRSILLLNVAMALRSWTQMTAAAFLPLFLMGHGVSALMAGSLLSFFLAGSVAGSLAGGWLGDRFGHKPTAVSMLSFAAIPTAVFYLSGELNILTLIALFLIAACLMGAQPSSIIWAQRLLPQHEGVAASMMMGLSFALGSVGVAISGAIADQIGLDAAMLMTIVPAALAALIAAITPSS